MTRFRLARVTSFAGLVALAAACAHGETARPEVGPVRLPVPAERAVCGWEQLEPSLPRVAVRARGTSAKAAPGQTRIVLAVDPEASYGTVARALAPAAASLVRLKVVVDHRWLLPLTHLRPVHPPPPLPSERWVSHVGRRKLTRSTAAPALRFAEIRVDGGEAVLHVENAAPGGELLPVALLADRLRRAEPPVGVVALTATTGTPWKQVRAAAVAAACYDRRPGEEPHEVLLDTQERKAAAGRSR